MGADEGGPCDDGTPRFRPVTTRDYLHLMKAVGVKELKARLSEFLRYVKAGEAVLITERGDVVAELCPTAATYALPGPDPALEALEAAGDVSPPRRPKGAWTWGVKGRGLPPGGAEALLARLREDR